MSYAPTAKHCIRSEPDGDEGAIIESDTTIFGPPTAHKITIDFELRPYRYGSGRAVLFDYAHYDGGGVMQSGINVQRWKDDLEVTIAGSVGSMGWAGVGPVFFSDNARSFIRVAIQYRVGPPPQCRLIVWAQRYTGIVLPWQNMVLDYPTGVNAQRWSFLRRKVSPGLLKLPFRGRLYQASVAKTYLFNGGATAMRLDGYEPTHASYFSIYGLKEGVGTAIVDTRAREPATIYDGAAPSTWEWIPEHWMHDTEYAGQHPASQRRLLYAGEHI